MGTTNAARPLAFLASRRDQKQESVLQLAHQGLLAMHLRHSTSPSQPGQLVTPCFCYMFYQVQRGATTKLSDNPKELEIIKYQKANSLGVFGCDAYKIFSDKKVDIGGMTTAPVLISPDFTKYFRKDKPDRYLNTPLFLDMWKQIKTDNTYSLYSWTVKADAATVFLPVALKKRLSAYPESTTGVYLETCNKVLQGYFGNLEVVSKNGMKRFLEQAETYYYSGSMVLGARTSSCRRPWMMLKFRKRRTSH